MFFFFFKQKTAYELRISDWSSDVCSSDLGLLDADLAQGFDRNEGVLAAADRDEGVAAQAELLPLPFQHFPLPFKGVRMACLRGTAAQASRTPGALPRAGRAGVGMGFGRAGGTPTPTQPSPSRGGTKSGLRGT